MPLRSSGPVLNVDDFAGVNSAIDEIRLPSGLVRWSYGGYYTERKEFERVPGKKPVGTSTAFGLLLNLKQLTFRDRSFVLFHSSNVYAVESDLSSLRSTVPVTSTYMDSFLIP